MFLARTPHWGSRRIQSELAPLGHQVRESTVHRYMLKHRKPGGGQAWLTFLRNHMKVTAACDFFIVRTVTFRSLLVFVVLSHDRRRIVHLAVTERPTAAWAAEGIELAFPDARHEMLVRDNDGVFGRAFQERIAALDIEDRPIQPASPWMNCFCERVIGTLRRECTDHIIALGPQHLEQALREYVAYYNEARPHLSLERNSPERGRSPTCAPPKLLAEPVLGGLHHRYRAAG